MLVRRDLSFTFPTSQEFHDILHTVRPKAAKLLPSSSNTIKSWILVYFKRQKSLLKDSLQQSVLQSHFTLDLRTSPNYITFLGVIPHFTLSSGTLTHALLALQEMEGSQGSENICHAFISIVEKFDIRGRIAYLMKGNATKNDTFIDCLDKKQADSGYLLDSQEHRHR